LSILKSEFNKKIKNKLNFEDSINSIAYYYLRKKIKITNLDISIPFEFCLLKNFIVRIVQYIIKIVKIFKKPKIAENLNLCELEDQSGETIIKVNQVKINYIQNAINVV
jgi:hypothetical protein